MVETVVIKCYPSPKKLEYKYTVHYEKVYSFRRGSINIALKPGEKINIELTEDGYVIKYKGEKIGKALIGMDGTTRR